MITIDRTTFELLTPRALSELPATLASQSETGMLPSTALDAKVHGVNPMSNRGKILR